MTPKMHMLVSGCAMIGGLSTYVVLKVNDFTLHHVQGPSMRPTLNPCGSYFSDIIVMKKVRNREESERLNRLSIIYIKHPKPERSYLVKRLIAHQNEQINTPNHKIDTELSVKVIPKGHCWVQSDAGPGYLDSTSYLGPIPYENILGKAVYVVWPPHRIKKL